MPPSLLGGSLRVPGTHVNLEGENPSANLMEVKASEAQGRRREAGSEGSMEQRCEPTNRNWISGATVGRAGVRLRSPYPSRAGSVNPAAVHRKWACLPRETCIDVRGFGKGLREPEGDLISIQESAEGKVRRKDTPEGPNGPSR